MGVGSMDVVAEGVSVISRRALWTLLQFYGVLGLWVSWWRVTISITPGLSAGMAIWLRKIQRVRLVRRYRSSRWTWLLSMVGRGLRSGGRTSRGRRWWCSDVRKAGVIGYARPQCADVVQCRYMEWSRCRSQIPSDTRRDRTFLEHARDGLYVKEMSEWLFEGGTTMPLQRMDAIRNVVVGGRGMREWKTSLSMRMGSGWVIALPKYFCFRSMDAQKTDAGFCGRFDERTTMLVPFYEFAMVLLVVARVLPPLSLAVRFPRVAHYFSNTEKSEVPKVGKRYECPYVVEWAYGIAAALGLDFEVFRRVSICDMECIAFLRKFVSFPVFFVDYIDYGVARVSLKTLVNVLDKGRVLTPEFVSYRMDYATRKRSPYATINKITQRFIRVGAIASDVFRPVLRSSQ